MTNETKKTYAAPRLEDRGSINTSTLGSTIESNEGGVPAKLF